MADPIQAGVDLLVAKVPAFTDFIVVRDTWRERDTAEQEDLMGGPDNETQNITHWDPGVDATCDWAVLATKTPAVKGDVIAETSGDERSFVVVDCETHNFGKGIRQTVTLRYKESLTFA